jgi:hypothetical protein
MTEPSAYDRTVNPTAYRRWRDDHTRISRQLLEQLRDDLTAIARIRAILAGWDDDEGGHSPDSPPIASRTSSARTCESGE